MLPKDPTAAHGAFVPSDSPPPPSSGCPDTFIPCAVWIIPPLGAWGSNSQQTDRSYILHLHFLAEVLVFLSSIFSSYLSHHSTNGCCILALLHPCKKPSSEEKIIFPVAFTKERGSFFLRTYQQMASFFQILANSQSCITCSFQN